MVDGTEGLMSPRLRRLFADFQRLTKIFEGHPYIAVKSVVGNPPEEYIIEYQVAGLREVNGKIEEGRGHKARIKLPAGYPREAPLCQMLTPVFHPNIAPHAICIADAGQWSASEPLHELVIRIGQMICYQRYNVKSPLNGEAARWASENIGRLPADKANLEPAVNPLDIDVSASAVKPPEEVRYCGKCGYKVSEIARFCNMCGSAITGARQS